MHQERGRRTSLLDLHSIATSWKLGYVPNPVSRISSASPVSSHMGRICTHLNSPGLQCSSCEGKVKHIQLEDTGH
ncbi:hypothetical protein KOW79_004296 [Hemibagrus wyckioides]|uniref:Uncharacterized protein n=1 Tax=Hemibagrus wyckioides TaxID=337641 RepID=A0A9D3P4S3_9TELE|nr:hypothetical protein KOW79_004296 [Hemibagrus wyckioides]